MRPSLLGLAAHQAVLQKPWLLPFPERPLLLSATGLFICAFSTQHNSCNLYLPFPQPRHRWNHFAYIESESEEKPFGEAVEWDLVIYGNAQKLEQQKTRLKGSFALLAGDGPGL